MEMKKIASELKLLKLKFICIHEEYGASFLFFTIILQAVVLVGFSWIGVVKFGSVWPLIIAVGGFIVGRANRQRMLSQSYLQKLPQIRTIFFIAYSIAIAGYYLSSVSREVFFIIVTLGSAACFNMYYWPLGDLAVQKHQLQKSDASESDVGGDEKI